ncbi:MAG: hypothetical protein EXR52_05850 [Dehalococcoidia bacterium]|nr:hypothetical protein [Dehalococcoidia bacterium]
MMVPTVLHPRSASPASGCETLDPTRRESTGQRGLLTLPLLLILAWMLRLYRSGRQGLSADEIATLQASQAPDLAAFLQSHAGLDHPPVYFLFERLWVSVAGTSEFALRFPSAAAGVAGVVLLYQTGRLLGAPYVAVVAALLVTISPLAVYFGQEARGYTFMLLGLTCCLWLALRLARGGRDRWWVLWGIVAAFTALTMYVAIPALAAMAAYVTWQAREQGRWRAWRWCVLAGALLFGAWAAYANPLSSVYDTAGDLTPRADMLTMLFRAVGAPVAGAFLPDPWVWFTAVPFLTMALAGATTATVSQRWLLAGSVLVSVTIVMLAAVDRLGFHPRYLLPALPATYLLAAMGMRQVRDWNRGIALAAGVLVLLPMAWALANAYVDPRYRRTDFKSAAGFLARSYHPGDVVIYNAPWAKGPFEYYVGHTLESIGLPTAALARSGETDQQLEVLRKRYQRIWLVRWQDWFTDPQRSLRAWLDSRLPKIFERQYPFVTVEGYLTRPPVEQLHDASTHPFTADFAGKVRLGKAAVDTGGVEDQGRLTVSVEWLSLGPTEQPYKVFVHLVDGNGTLLAQGDREPVFGMVPTTRWQPNTLVRDDYEILLPDHVAEGPYDVNLGLYLERGERLDVTGAGANFARVASGLWLKR